MWQRLQDPPGAVLRALLAWHACLQGMALLWGCWGPSGGLFLGFTVLSMQIRRAVSCDTCRRLLVGGATAKLVALATHHVHLCWPVAIGSLHLECCSIHLSVRFCTLVRHQVSARPQAHCWAGSKGEHPQHCKMGQSSMVKMGKSSMMNPDRVSTHHASCFRYPQSLSYWRPRAHACAFLRTTICRQCLGCRRHCPCLWTDRRVVGLGGVSCVGVAWCGVFRRGLARAVAVAGIFACERNGVSGEVMNRVMCV